MPGVDGVERRK